MKSMFRNYKTTTLIGMLESELSNDSFMYTDLIDELKCRCYRDADLAAFQCLVQLDLARGQDNDAISTN